MQRLLDWLRSPFPLDMGIARQFRLGLYYGVFVFLFLYGFRPFGLAEYEGDLLAYTMQAGLLTGLLLPCFNLLATALLPRVFNEEVWTVGRSLLWSLVFTGLLGLANTAHAAWWFHAGLDIMDILRFEAYTLGIAIFPISGSLLAEYQRLMAWHGKESARLDILLHHDAKAVPQPAPAQPEMESTVRLPNGKEELSLPVAELRYLRAADNYIEVYQLAGDKVQRHVLRATLAEAEARLAEFPGWCRCHKSYLVQLAHVRHVTGNAQGCRLHFADGLADIPVSRNRIEEVRGRLLPALF
jgi:LytTr DNA-binding domain